ncbi:MAG: M20/M25/M40 family metallo-hydrolase [Nitrososphaeria archaeon]|jgi:LysW-gamma-L-lysine carboxypeptidase
MDYVDLLYELVSIYSPSGCESTLADRIRVWLTSDLSADSSYIDAAGNVIGIYEGTEPSILLCGHLDTVVGELPTQRNEQFISGRGAVDAKSPMAAFLCAAHELKEGSFRNKIIVAGVVGEEDTGNGIKELIRGGCRPSYVVFGEPCSLTNIVIGYRGGLRLSLSFETSSYHSSSPWLGKSAVDAAIELWTSIKRYNDEAQKKEKKFGTISACLTKISGGESHNMSPSSCKMTVDVRFPPSVESEEVVEKIKVEAEHICEEKIGFRMEVEDFTPAYTAPVNSQLVKAFKASILKVKGKNAMLVRKTGSGDMNIYGKEVGVPSITYGPGNSKLSHTPYERVEIREYLDSIEVLKEAIINVCGENK